MFLFLIFFIFLKLNFSETNKLSLKATTVACNI